MRFSGMHEVDKFSKWLREKKVQAAPSGKELWARRSAPPAERSKRKVFMQYVDAVKSKASDEKDVEICYTSRTIYFKSAPVVQQKRIGDT
eukprot:1158858-Prorocentrum_lima.AAC.1